MTLENLEQSDTRRSQTLSPNTIPDTTLSCEVNIYFPERVENRKLETSRERPVFPWHGLLRVLLLSALSAFVEILQFRRWSLHVVPTVGWWYRILSKSASMGCLLSHTFSQKKKNLWEVLDWKKFLRVEKNLEK